MFIFFNFENHVFDLDLLIHFSNALSSCSFVFHVISWSGLGNMAPAEAMRLFVKILEVPNCIDLSIM